MAAPRSIIMPYGNFFHEIKILTGSLLVDKSTMSFYAFVFQ